MRATIASALLALTIVSGSAVAASAACTVDHWTNDYNGHPVFKCDNGSRTW